MSSFNTLVDTLFTDKKKKKLLIDEIGKLNSKDKKFINEKAESLLTIDKEIEKNFSEFNPELKKLEMNTLMIFILSKVTKPDCSAAITEITTKFNAKLRDINTILEKKIGSENESSVISNEKKSQSKKIIRKQKKKGKQSKQT